MQQRQITNRQEYFAALELYERIKTAQPDTAEGECLETLIASLDAFESAQYPTSPADPVDCLEFEMERLGLSELDLVPFIGTPNRVYEILNRKRKLSLQMIRRLHRGLGIPLDVLLSQE